MKNKKIWLITGAIIVVLILVTILGSKMGWLGGGYVKLREVEGGVYYVNNNGGYRSTYTPAAQRFMDRILGIKHPAQTKNTSQ